MFKKMANGSKALAAFNRDVQNETTFTVNRQDIGLGSDSAVFDVWRQKSLGKHEGGISILVRPNGVGLLINK